VSDDPRTTAGERERERETAQDAGRQEDDGRWGGGAAAGRREAARGTGHLPSFRTSPLG